MCGDGYWVTGETCDSGVLPGCKSNCIGQLPCHSCSGGGPLGPDICLDLCNDPNPLNIPNELGWECNVGTCWEDCGDSIYVGSETCEDGNEVDNDGCSSWCLFEPGWMA